MNQGLTGGLFTFAGFVFWIEALRARRRGTPAPKVRRMVLLGAVALFLAAWQFGQMW